MKATDILYLFSLFLKELPQLPDMAAFPPIIADIVRDCLQFDPASRPTANDIAERLAQWKFREMDLNRDERGNTLLHQAVKSDDEKRVDELLKSDIPAMVNAVNLDGKTALELAEPGPSVINSKKREACILLVA